jgi:hypothetical protein
VGATLNGYIIGHRKNTKPNKLVIKCCISLKNTFNELKAKTIPVKSTNCNTTRIGRKINVHGIDTSSIHINKNNNGNDKRKFTKVVSTLTTGSIAAGNNDLVIKVPPEAIAIVPSAKADAHQSQGKSPQKRKIA